MLGKLFKKKKSPINNGDLIEQSHITNLRIKKVFELELVNMEGNPCYRLSSKLGFGSEIGEVIISDESISPRHCTFTLEQDVISLIDHNSLEGTLVNNIRMEPGKSLILDESDEIQIGQLLIRIKTHNEAVVREKKTLAAMPEAASIVDTAEEDLTETTEENLSEEIGESSDLVNELTQLEDKFQDDTHLTPVPHEGLEVAADPSLLEEKGIHIEEIVKSSTQTSAPVEESEGPAAVQEDHSQEISVDDILAEEDEELSEEVFEEDEEDEEDEEELPERTSVFRRMVRKFKRKKKTGRSFRDRSRNVVLVKKYAANTILRLAALHVDFCFAYGTYLLISPFDDFKNLVAGVVTKGKEYLEIISQSPQFLTYEKDISFLLEMLKDLWTVLDNYINPIPTLILLMISKLLFSLILGVSLGQFLVGIKGEGNIIWKRVGGVLRTLIGFITFPFLIFDIGAVISRRTFKEVITFTRLYSDSKVLNIILSIVFIGISGLFVLMAPMFQGFETVTRYEMPKKVEERIRIDNGEGTEEEVTQAFASQFLGFKVDLSKEFEVFPAFKFEGAGRKTSSQFVLNIYDGKMEGSSQIEMVKTFDLKQLLEIGFKGNPFLKLKFPHVDNFIHQHTPVGFKRSVLDSESFAQELMEFHRMAMDISLESYFDYIHEVPLVSSLLNYKQSFISLFDDISIQEMNFIKVGNVFALKISQEMPNHHDYLIPILAEGRVMKISFQGENPAGLASRLYRYALYQSDWTKELPMTAFDRVLKALREGQEVSIEDAQAIYGHYFELSQKVLADISHEKYQLLRKSVKSVQLLIDGVPKNGSEALLKLESNFKDLVDAVEIQNMEYFSLEETTIL